MPVLWQRQPAIKKLQNTMAINAICLSYFPQVRSTPMPARAEAAEAAGAQGKFWEMHDYLYEHPEALDVENLARAAGVLGLDKVKFDRELPSASIPNGCSRTFRVECSGVAAHRRSSLMAYATTTMTIS